MLLFCHSGFSTKRSGCGPPSMRCAAVAAHDHEVAHAGLAGGRPAGGAGWAGRATCTMHLGISSVLSPSRLPRPAATMMARALVCRSLPSFIGATFPASAPRPAGRGRRRRRGPRSRRAGKVEAVGDGHEHKITRVVDEEAPQAARPGPPRAGRSDRGAAAAPALWAKPVAVVARAARHRGPGGGEVFGPADEGGQADARGHRGQRQQPFQQEAHVAGVAPQPRRRWR